MKFIISHALSESWRRKGYYLVCLFGCFLVCLVALISKSLSIQGSLIFFMLSEKQTGEMDILFKPIIRYGNYTDDSLTQNIDNDETNSVADFFIDSAFINYTLFSNIMASNSEETKSIWKQSTNRLTLEGTLEDLNTEVYLHLINSTKEKELEIGRTFPEYNLSFGECIVHKNIKQHISSNLTNIHLNMTDFIQATLLNQYHSHDLNITTALKLKSVDSSIVIPCKIKMVINDNYGKFSNNDKDNNIIIMESSLFFAYLSQFIPSNITEIFPDYISKIKQMDINDYSNTVIVNFPPNRMTSYIETSYDVLLEKGVKYANEIIKEVNSFEALQVSMPLIRMMRMYNFGSVLLNMILSIIIIALFILSLILIYSLLMITIETNSFEFGILRLIGATKNDLILIVIIQCLSFSVPAFVLAFGAHFYILDLLNQLIKSFIHSDLNISFHYGSLFISLFVNFLAPIVAAILPLRAILKKNISQSLNSMINQTKGIKVEIISLERNEINLMLIFGSISFLYGASIYYFLPLSLISTNYGMLCYIFIWILLGIIIGFIILSMNIENVLQKGMTNLLFIFSKSYTKMLVIKNLAAHRIKNRRTSIMYSLTVGIFIMSSVSLNILIQSVQKEALMIHGTEIVLSSVNGYISPHQIRFSLMDMFMKDAIEMFSFKTPPLANLCFSSTSIKSLGTSFNFYTDFIGVSSNFFGILDKDFLKIAENTKYSNKKYNNIKPTEQLYLKENIGKVGISAIFTWEFDVHLDTDFHLKIDNEMENIMMNLMTKPAFIIDSAAGIQMNSEPSMMYQRATILSLPLYMDLTDKCSSYFSIEQFSQVKDFDYQIETIYLRPNPNIPIDKALDIISTIINEDPNYNVKIWLFNNIRSRIKGISKIIYTIFNTFSTIVLFFCFFNLAASMTINIFDQKKEIAILRSIGMKSNDIIFIFVSEAVILILTSSIIGTVIGSAISYTMSLQWQIFTNISITFSLDLLNLSLIVVFSIVGGVISTIIPALNMMNVSISELIRSV